MLSPSRTEEYLRRQQLLSIELSSRLRDIYEINTSLLRSWHPQSRALDNWGFPRYVESRRFATGVGRERNSNWISQLMRWIDVTHRAPSTPRAARSLQLCPPGRCVDWPCLAFSKPGNTCLAMRRVIDVCVTRWTHAKLVLLHNRVTALSRRLSSRRLGESPFMRERKFNYSGRTSV